MSVNLYSKLSENERKVMRITLGGLINMKKIMVEKGL